MPWFRISDDATDHPKVEAAGNEAFGLWVRLGSYAARQLTDGVIPASVATRYGEQRLIDRLVAVRLLDVVEGGWAIHDYLDHNPSRAEILADRAVKKAAAVDPELRGIVKARDGNRCRYQGCARPVSWADRRTVRGGVLDLVDPSRPVNLDNLVVACRGCQKRHVGVAADAAGLALGPIPTPPGPGRPTRSRSESRPEPTQNRPRTDPAPIQIRAESSPDPIQTPDPSPSPLRGGDGDGERTPAQRLAAPPPASAGPPPPAPATRERRAAHASRARAVLLANARAAGRFTVLSRTGQRIHIHPEPPHRQLPLALYLEAVPAPDCPDVPVPTAGLLASAAIA